MFSYLYKNKIDAMLISLSYLENIKKKYCLSINKPYV